MLQWFISLPEFAEFTEILFYLGKTQLDPGYDQFDDYDLYAWSNQNRNLFPFNGDSTRFGEF